MPGAPVSRPWIRRCLLALAVVAMLLVLYVGSFVVIGWVKPQALLVDRPLLAYSAVYWPLRWLVAEERPSFLPWWRSTAMIEGRVLKETMDGLLIELEGGLHSYYPISPAMRVNPPRLADGQLKPDLRYRAQIRARVRTAGNYRHFIVWQLEEILEYH